MQRYGEISSASNCTDYQARRLGCGASPPPLQPCVPFIEAPLLVFLHCLQVVCVAPLSAVVCVPALFAVSARLLPACDSRAPPVLHTQLCPRCEDAAFDAAPSLLSHLTVPTRRHWCVQDPVPTRGARGGGRRRRRQEAEEAEEEGAQSHRNAVPAGAWQTSASRGCWGAISSRPKLGRSNLLRDPCHRPAPTGGCRPPGADVAP